MHTQKRNSIYVYYHNKKKRVLLFIYIHNKTKKNILIIQNAIIY